MFIFFPFWDSYYLASKLGYPCTQGQALAEQVKNKTSNSLAFGAGYERGEACQVGRYPRAA